MILSRRFKICYLLYIDFTVSILYRSKIFRMAASEGDYPSEDDNIPSLDGASNDTTKGPASLHSPLPETGPPPEDVVSMMQQMKLDYKKSKTSDKKPIFEPGKNCVRKTLKITSIDPDEFRRICNLLNIPRVLGGDWRSLAGKLRYTVLDINIFEQTKNLNGPTGCFLQQWDSDGDHFADEIIKILKGMNRDDVVNVLEAEIQKICQGCNCENCESTR